MTRTVLSKLVTFAAFIESISFVYLSTVLMRDTKIVLHVPGILEQVPSSNSGSIFVGYMSE